MFTRILCLGLLCLALPATAKPHWIWTAGTKPGDRVNFKHTFKIPHGTTTASLRLVADFATASLSINGRHAATAEPFGPVVKIDARPFIRPGSNEIQIIGKPVLARGPAVGLQLDCTTKNGIETTIGTSTDWTSDKVKVIDLGDLGLEKWWTLPPLVIDETDDYTQWKRASNANAATDAQTLQLLPGYEAELLRSAGKDEGSWVSIAFDRKGRLTVAREDKGLIRYSFSKDRKQITKSETINDDLRECRGLLYAHDSLFAHANNSKGLYRLRDTNGDGKFDEKKLLHTSEGGVGHGRNDLALGPNGMIYAINGDSVQLPSNLPDRTSPLRKNIQPFRNNEGHVIRMNPDGTGKEIFCGGLRNPYGIAFNTDGEPFTYDADAEFDMGTPWYRPTEVKHLTSGADFGWRAVTGSWPPYFPDHPDNTQATLDIGKGSPTGVKFGTRSHFPVDYQKALFILDWTYGRILAVHLTPRGSTYMGTAEVFLRGQPLNLTDLAFGPDGAMYFVTGGRKTQSGLYRVRYTNQTPQPRAATPQEAIRDKLCQEFRDQRRITEADHIGQNPMQPPHPKITDHRIQQARRITMEKRHVQKSVRPTATTNNLETLTALANTATTTELSNWLSANSGFDSLLDSWHTLPQSGQLGFIDLLRRAMDRHKLSHKSLQAIQTSLQPRFPHASSSINQAIAPLLIRLNPIDAIPITVKLLEASNDQRERILYLHHLRNAKKGWTPSSRRIFFRALNDYETFLGGRGLPQALGHIRREALATLTPDEKENLANIINHRPKLPPLPDLTDRKFVKDWKATDFKNALDFDPAKRNLARGQKMFHLAMCSRCHRHGTVGYPIGPDLSHVARRFNRNTILEEIITPSSTIAENHQTSVLKLKNGNQLTGQIIPNLDYRAPNLQLAENPLFPDKITKIPKSDIANRTRSKVSLMPAGLLNNLSLDEILDLIAWLERGSP